MGLLPFSAQAQTPEQSAGTILGNATQDKDIATRLRVILTQPESYDDVTIGQ